MISELADLADYIKDNAPPELLLRASETSSWRYVPHLRGYGPGWKFSLYLYFPKDTPKSRKPVKEYEADVEKYLESIKLWPIAVAGLPIVDSRDPDLTMLALVFVREKDWPGIAVAERLKGNIV